MLVTEVSIFKHWTEEVYKLSWHETHVGLYLRMPHAAWRVCDVCVNVSVSWVEIPTSIQSFM